MDSSPGAVSPELVLLERPEQGVALLRLNRPAVLNALNMRLREALAEHVRRLDECADTRVIVLTGNGTAFAAGADLNELAEASALEIQQRGVERHWQALATCRKPLIAAVEGYALGGGCELAMHCDLIVAGASARFAQPEVRVGVMPGAGGTQRLVRAVGKFQALRMLFTGCTVRAPEALAIGLVSEVAADGQALDRALELARQIAGLPPLALAQIKEVVLAGADLPLDQALALERKAFQLLFDSHDQKEGMRAFLENAQRSTWENERATDRSHRYCRYRCHGPGHRPARCLCRAVGAALRQPPGAALQAREQIATVLARQVERAGWRRRLSSARWAICGWSRTCGSQAAASW